MPSPLKLAHVVLFSAQVKAMRDWYVRVLEAEVVHENDFVAFITYDEEHHRIAVADRNAASKSTDGIDKLVQPTSGAATAGDFAPNRGLSHIAFTYGSLKDLLDNYERLRGDDIVPIFAINHGTTNSLYYADPDGNHIELQVDNFATIQEGTAFMRSEAFRANPVGRPIDPDGML